MKRQRKNPYLVSIGERAEKIVQAFMEKQKTAQESLKELEEKISEINKAKMEQAEKDMNQPCLRSTGLCTAMGWRTLKK